MKKKTKLILIYKICKSLEVINCFLIRLSSFRCIVRGMELEATQTNLSFVKVIYHWISVFVSHVFVWFFFFNAIGNIVTNNSNHQSFQIALINWSSIITVWQEIIWKIVCINSNTRICKLRILCKNEVGQGRRVLHFCYDIEKSSERSRSFIIHISKLP